MTIDGIYWLQHCLCWFGFNEPAKFVLHKEGGYFASVATGVEIPSLMQNGLRSPLKGVNK